MITTFPHQFLNSTKNSFWIDCCNPTSEELELLAREFHLHPTSVQDCLDPRHLPKVELISGCTFVLLRVLDEKAPPQADTFLAISRKIAIFYREEFVITIHRGEHEFLNYYKNLLRSPDFEGIRTTEYFVLRMIRRGIESFDTIFLKLENGLDDFEVRLFDGLHVSNALKEIHILRRQISALKRLMWHTLSFLPGIVIQHKDNTPYLQDVKEMAQRQFVHGDELLEEASNLLSTHLSLAGHKTNEVIKLLTLFSIFFMPLTFIVGIYGMNFKVFPELEWAWGYPGVWIVMITFTVALYIFIKKKGWWSQ